MATYHHIQVPAQGHPITMGSNHTLNVPDYPIIPFIEGDGTGRDIWKACVRVLDASVEKAYGNKRKIAWMEVFAGEKATKIYGEHSWLPQETVEAFRTFLVGIKGPLTTPIGGGIRSLNVALRQDLDLYVCLRPVKYYAGTPSPVKRPEAVDMVIFRENTEDIYAGIEWAAGTPDAHRILEFLHAENPNLFGKIRFGTEHAVAEWNHNAKLAAAGESWLQVGVGIKPVSKLGSERLIRSAIQYALVNKRKSVTIVHKGNIMKFTEGAFRDWSYALAEREFPDQCYTWSQWERTKKLAGEEIANAEQKAALAQGKILIKDAIADIALQQVLTRPEEFDVIATLNLNGDYLSDALAAQVGGIGIAPGGNLNYVSGHAIFEATHGTAPKYADLDKVNPGSMILSGEMMLRHLGWDKAADFVNKGLAGAITSRRVTYDFARQMDNATEIHCSEFGSNIIDHM